ncbi:MAG: MmcQ/YjbR family DNA-binding protein [Chloroflexi bacterium]|nr:MmcQ/YjbR family DNA-binding protein [Chloroflexota bacterium]MCC6893526.1 MmcQ/YjbR family DNA-binding protein [Anaerolineae bacterium]
MDVETLKDYALSKPSTTSDFPFDEETLVIRVMGKIFALMSLNDSPSRVNLKCDPVWAEVLRQSYAAITAGYHMNKRHWNTILFDDTVPDDEILEMVDHAYEQVVKGLPKKDRERLKQS